MSTAAALVRNEVRILRHDPVPAVTLVVMPVVLMALLSPAIGLSLEALGRQDVPGSGQTVPGMISVFSLFSVAIVGFNLFREHGWRTWPRLRAAGVGGAPLLAGKLAVPGAQLAVQHLLLFGFGIVVLDLPVRGSYLALVVTSLVFAALVLALGLAAAAAFSTIQQLDAATNVGAMVLGGLGGGFVPVETLPAAVRWLAPISPTYWAVQAYEAILVDGAGLTGVLGTLGVLALWTAGAGAVAVWRLRLDVPKRTWG